MEPNQQFPDLPYANKPSRGKWFVVGAVLISLLVGGGAVSFLLGDSAKDSAQEEVEQLNQALQERVIQPGSEKYSVLYRYQKDSKGADTIETLFKSDITGENKIAVETGTSLEQSFRDSFFISKNGRYIGREHRNVEIASVESNLSFKDITGELVDGQEEVGDIIWSDDGSKLLYNTYNTATLKDWPATEKEILSMEFETRLYLIDRDGKNKKLVVETKGKDVYKPLAFSILKGELYALVEEITGDAEDRIAIFDLLTGKIKYTFTLPGRTLGNRFSIDFRKFYYLSSNEDRIIERDLMTNIEKTVYENTSVGAMLRFPYLFVVPPKDETMFIVTLSGNDPNYRKIEQFNPSDGRVETLFEASDPQYRAMHVEEKSVSPNAKFVWLETNDGVYIFDVPNRKMNKFLSVEKFPKEFVQFIGWLVE